jgi:hypothetical protein
MYWQQTYYCWLWLWQTTDPSSRQRERPTSTNYNSLTVIKVWSWAPDGCFIPRQTGRLTVGRNIRFRLRKKKDQNGVTRSSDQNGATRSPARMERVLGSHLLWLIIVTSDFKGVISKADHPIQTPLLLVTMINRDNMFYIVQISVKCFIIYYVSCEISWKMT